MHIQTSHITKTYPGGKQALSDINISIDAPTFIGLLGPNGAGKSTLMKLLTLGLLPSSGEIMVNGKPLLECEKEFKLHLGYLPQEYGLHMAIRSSYDVPILLCVLWSSVRSICR